MTYESIIIDGSYGWDLEGKYEIGWQQGSTACHATILTSFSIHIRVHHIRCRATPFITIAFIAIWCQPLAIVVVPMLSRPSYSLHFLRRLRLYVDASISDERVQEIAEESSPYQRHQLLIQQKSTNFEAPNTHVYCRHSHGFGGGVRRWYNSVSQLYHHRSSDLLMLGCSSRSRPDSAISTPIRTEL